MFVKINAFNFALSGFGNDRLIWREKIPFECVLILVLPQNAKIVLAYDDLRLFLAVLPLALAIINSRFRILHRPLNICDLVVLGDQLGRCHELALDRGRKQPRCEHRLELEQREPRLLREAEQVAAADRRVQLLVQQPRGRRQREVVAHERAAFL